MKRFLAHLFIAALLLLLTVGPTWAQRGGAQGGGRPSAPAGGAAPNVPNQPTGPNQSQPQLQTPLYVNGRVLLSDTGQPAPEPVSVQLNCGVSVLQVIQTDLKGYFQFTLGAGPQSNANLGAAADTPIGMSGGGLNFPGSQGRIGGFGDLTGCEIRAVVDGYLPATHILSGPPELTTLDAGTIRLTRIAGVQGSAISVTSLLVPNNARKEFERGGKDAQDKKLKPAAEHFEKAVAEYDNYAAAWNALGGVYASSSETDKARQAFSKAISVDPKYIPPYMNLATLQLRNQEYEDCIATAGRALDLDPALPLANYLQAAGNFKLSRLDEAEKSAKEVEKGPHENLQQVYPLLAEIFLLKHDYPNAATQMRIYLKQWPKGPYAAEMKKGLDQIENSGTAAESQNKPSSARP
jgi:tetratricopeptide (TPR) repeat protein